MNKTSNHPWKASTLIIAVVLVVLLAVGIPLAITLGDDPPPTSKESSSSPAPQTTVTPQTSAPPPSTTVTPVTSTPETTPPIVYPETYPSQLKGFETEDDVVEFLYVEGGNGTYTADSIWVDPGYLDLNDVDMRIIARNSKIQEILGVEIYSFTNESLGIGDLQSEAKEYFDTQSDELDVYCGVQYYDISVATSGNLVNLNTLVNDNGEKLIDIEKPYWAGDYIKELTYGDDLYWVTGDLALRYIGGVYCAFVNEALYDQYVKESYQGKSIRTVVEEGEWTITAMLEMAAIFEEAYAKENGSDNGVYGIVFENNDTIDGIAMGCGVSFSQKTPDGINVTLGIDQNAAELAGYLSTMRSSSYAYLASSEEGKSALDLFSEEKALFTFGVGFDGRKIAVESGLKLHDPTLPLPKLNNSQELYQSGVREDVTIFGISKYSNCKKTAAATLELMSYYSRDLVRPFMMAELLVLCRCPINYCMYETSIDRITTDFVVAWSKSLNDIGHFYREEWKSTCNPTKPTTNPIREVPRKLVNLLKDLENAGKT